MSSGHVLVLAIASGFYVLQAVLGLTRLHRSRRAGAAERWGPLLAALLLHTGFLVGRAIEARGLPFLTRLDSVALFLWVTAVVFLAGSRPYRLEKVAPLFWTLFAVGALAMWAFASRERIPGASLAGFWLLLHLVPVYIGYAGFAVGAGVGAAYLVQEQLLRRRATGEMWRRLPSLEMLERVGRAALSLGFPMLSIGLVAGVFWAEQSAAPLGRAWYADPKVIGGAVVWLFYAGVLHVRLYVRLRGRRAAWLTIAGFLLTLVSFATVHVYTRAADASPDGAQTHGDTQGKP